jgi:hypothetical protein
MAGPRLGGELRGLARRSLSADPAQRPTPERWVGALDKAIARTPASPPPPPRVEPPVRTPAPEPTAGPRAVPSRTIRQPRPSRRWLVFAPAAVALIGMIIGLANRGDEPSVPLAGRLTAAPFLTLDPQELPHFTVPGGLPGVAGMPGGLPGVPGGLTALPTFALDPVLPTIDVLCAATEVKIGPGLNPKSSRLRRATGPVESFACSLARNDRKAGFSGRGARAPDATQRSRFAKLAAGGPYGRATIIGVRTGPGGATQVNVVFQPRFGGAGDTCWRSRLSLVKTDDGYGVSALTAPAAVSCG